MVFVFREDLQMVLMSDSLGLCHTTRMVRTANAAAGLSNKAWTAVLAPKDLFSNFNRIKDTKQILHLK